MLWRDRSIYFWMAGWMHGGRKGWRKSEGGGDDEREGGREALTNRRTDFTHVESKIMLLSQFQLWTTIAPCSFLIPTWTVFTVESRRTNFCFLIYWKNKKIRLWKWTKILKFQFKGVKCFIRTPGTIYCMLSLRFVACTKREKEYFNSPEQSNPVQPWGRLSLSPFWHGHSKRKE